MSHGSVARKRYKASDHRGDFVTYGEDCTRGHQNKKPAARATHYWASRTSEHLKNHRIHPRFFCRCLGEWLENCESRLVALEIWSPYCCKQTANTKRESANQEMPFVPDQDLCLGVLASSVEIIFAAAGGAATWPDSTISLAGTSLP